MRVQREDTVIVNDNGQEYKAVVKSFRKTAEGEEILASRIYSKEVTASSWVPVKNILRIQQAK